MAFQWNQGRGGEWIDVAQGLQNFADARQMAALREQAAQRQIRADEQAQRVADLKYSGDQLALRGQILGTAKTPEDYATALGEVKRLGLPTHDLPEATSGESIAWQTFKRAPDRVSALPAWLPQKWIPAGMDLPEAQQSTEMPSGDLRKGATDMSLVQSAAERGLPLNLQQKFRDSDLARQIQLANLERNLQKDDLSREWMAFNRDARIQSMSEAEKQREFQRIMAEKGYGLDVQRLDIARAAESRAAATTPTSPKFTADQTNAATFGRRLEQALPYLQQAYQSFDPTTVQGAAQVAAAKRGGVASLASNPAARSAVTAELNILSAILRKESGAAISESEYESAGKIYFPRFGDTPEVRAQKAAALNQALAGLKTAAGSAWDATPLVSPTSTRDAPPNASGGYAYTMKHLGATYGRNSPSEKWKRIR